jgi:hypothetical protein
LNKRKQRHSIFAQQAEMKRHVAAFRFIVLKFFPQAVCDDLPDLLFLGIS